MRPRAFVVLRVLGGSGFCPVRILKLTYDWDVLRLAFRIFAPHYARFLRAYTIA
jgi:hypothetical protein